MKKKIEASELGNSLEFRSTKIASFAIFNFKKIVDAMKDCESDEEAFVAVQTPRRKSKRQKTSVIREEDEDFSRLSFQPIPSTLSASASPSVLDVDGGSCDSASLQFDNFKPSHSVSYP